MTEITEDDPGLLRSYASGPRIWDAAALMPAVWRLLDQGLIEPAPPADDNGPPSRGACQLTGKGRQVLADADAQAIRRFSCPFCGRPKGKPCQAVKDGILSEPRDLAAPHPNRLALLSEPDPAIRGSFS